jgi:hypothetical protein
MKKRSNLVLQEEDHKVERHGLESVAVKEDQHKNQCG